LKSFFTISLDFELFWGVLDSKTLAGYGKNVLGERIAIPKMLELFQKYEIEVTWATVGFIFCESKAELLQSLPEKLPSYKKKVLSPYSYINEIGRNEIEDPLHFASSLIRKIRNTPGQEIGCHTFSHYYCVEDGQNNLEFRADLKAALQVAKSTQGIDLKSIVFPRNQINPDYLQTCVEGGISSYRGNPTSWAYRSASRADNSLPKRMFRLMDSYFNLSGSLLCEVKVDKSGILNIPASMFLRPYSNKLSFLEWLKVNRIKRSMTHAAKAGRGFHLWWHPHNFGCDVELNLNNLNIILMHFKKLERAYGMKSMNMQTVASNFQR
jgi:peptidoglycan/xylan/chitin deacetylase (PgdA/CDA1 family)